MFKGYERDSKWYWRKDGITRNVKKSGDRFCGVIGFALTGVGSQTESKRKVAYNNAILSKVAYNNAIPFENLFFVLLQQK